MSVPVRALHKASASVLWDKLTDAGADGYVPTVEERAGAIYLIRCRLAYRLVDHQDPAEGYGSRWRYFLIPENEEGGNE